MSNGILTSDPAPASTPDVNSAPPADPASSNAAADWRAVLPADIKDDPSLKAITDINGLAKSYVHSQKMLGADKIIVPNKYATDADWKNVFHKLGLPETVDKYEVKAKEGVDAAKDPFFVGFKSIAHQAGVLPQQAQKLYEWYETESAKFIEEQQKVQKEALEKEVQALKQEWGQAYDMKVRAAKAVIEKFGGDDFKEFLDQTGLTNNAKFAKFLATVGESFAEDTIKGDGDKAPVMTPQYAQKEINKVFADPKHPYFDKMHPQHKEALAEMARLFELQEQG